MLSPILWSATGAMFGIYAIANLVIALLVRGADPSPLLPEAAALGVAALTIFLTRPPEPDSAGAHVLLATIWVLAAGSVAAHAPHGSATVIAGLFLGPMLAIRLTNHRHIALHLAGASALLLGLAAFGGQDQGTLFAIVTYVPALWVLTVCCVIVLDAVEAQGIEYERLAMRDALTDVGNERLLDENLAVEIARHRSTADPFVLVDLRLDAFQALNLQIGRAAGDGILAGVAARLRALAPSGSTVARIGGERFAVLLPTTARDGGEAFVDALEQALGTIDTGTPTALNLRAGVAAFPADAERRQALRALAEERRTLAAPRHITPQSVAADASLAVHAPPLGPVEPAHATLPAGTPSPDARDDAWADTRVQRRGIARDPLVWRCTSAVILFYVAMATAAQVVQPSVVTAGTIAVTAVAAVVGLATLAMQGPAIGTRANHAVVAASWALPLAAAAALAPHASWASGTGVFAGALIATRLTDRRHIVAHLLAGSTVLWVLLLSGRVDTAAILAGLTTLLSTWVLAICYTVVYEATEEQGEAMEELVLRDPLTGAGNERLLRERLADELPRHEDMQMPLVVMDLDLDGLDVIREQEGRGAAAGIIGDVATLLANAGGPGATVARIGGHHFRVLLPLAAEEDLADTIRDLRRAIADTSRHRRRVLSRIGCATFPEDGEDAATLIATARSRRLADNARSHDLTRRPEPSDEHLPLRRIVDRRPDSGEHRGVERRSSVG